MSRKEQIKFFRKARGLTQQELAEAVGVTHDQISQIERGKSAIGQKTFEKICQQLGIEEKLVLK